MKQPLFTLTSLLLIPLAALRAADAPWRVAIFEADATPPIGSPLCNGAVKPAKEIVTPLAARGVALLGAGRPIVLCAFDWWASQMKATMPFAKRWQWRWALRQTA
ncbi:MAG: hypothetical protein M3463_11340 [Verrucomicrobiota bacterium]|nr:hypothetical protein [Verrucomicrobiota bacterium]